METYRAAAMADAIAEIKTYNRAQLAARADCCEPSHESEGAAMLESIRDGVVEMFDYDAADLHDPEDFDRIDDDGTLHEIADGAPSVYTATKWAQFVDLGAFWEDPTELGSDCSNMDDAAGVCLYLIASRLAHALVEEVREAVAEACEEDDETAEVSP